MNSSKNCTAATLQTASPSKLTTAPALAFAARGRSQVWMPKTAFQSLNGQKSCPKYGSQLESRILTEQISLQFKPGSVDDAYSHNMMSHSFKDLETGLLRVKNREPQAKIPRKHLAASSKSINESPLQEDYANGRPKHDTYKIQDNGNVSKRKAGEMERNAASKCKPGEMERKAASVGIQSGKKVEQDPRIVRVSRLTGGKDRHSKVLTAKGLRDRRLRLSVHTAIQLYDLQDRLGIEQPSMAVDWLIKAAKLAIDQLTVRDTEMASASAGNAAQLTSSDCSNVEHGVGSSRESATATAASPLSAFSVGQGTNSHKVTNEKVKSITTIKETDLGRSCSSTSDGSVKGSAELTSNCSKSKPVSRVEARLKARERARKKSSSAKKSDGFPLDIHQLKSMQPSLTSLSKNVYPYTTLPLESQCRKDDNPCGIHAQVLSGTGSVQQLFDYNNTPSYTDMLCTEDSLTLQNMASLTAAFQKYFPPVPSTLASMQAVIGSSLLQSYEKADSVFPFFHSKESRHLEGNAGEGQGNHFFSNIPHINIGKSVEQQAQINNAHFASTIVPTFSGDLNFSTSSLSRREPLQSNSSHTQKNACGEASAKTAPDFVHLQNYDASVFQESHNAQHNVNYEHNHSW